MAQDFYSQWIERQADTIEAGMRDAGRKGVFTMAVWCVPARGPIEGKLILADALPDGATEVVRIGPHGSNVMSCPYSHLRSLLWNACRSLPILPVD